MGRGLELVDFFCYESKLKKGGWGSTMNPNVCVCGGGGGREN